MKKLFALFLTVCLVLSALCLPAAAEETWVEVSTWGELYAALAAEGGTAASIKLTDDISIKDSDSVFADSTEIAVPANKALLGASAVDTFAAWNFTGVFLLSCVNGPTKSMITSLL